MMENSIAIGQVKGSVSLTRMRVSTQERWAADREVYASNSIAVYLGIAAFMAFDLLRGAAGANTSTMLPICRKPF